MKSFSPDIYCDMSLNILDKSPLSAVGSPLLGTRKMMEGRGNWCLSRGKSARRIYIIGYGVTGEEKEKTLVMG